MTALQLRHERHVIAVGITLDDHTELAFGRCHAAEYASRKRPMQAMRQTGGGRSGSAEGNASERMAAGKSFREYRFSVSRVQRTAIQAGLSRGTRRCARFIPR